MEGNKNGLIVNPATEINNLYNEIQQGVQTTLLIAIHLGELLTLQKENVGQGNWMAWVEKNLNFSLRSVNEYTRVFRHKEEIVNSRTSANLNIKEALKLLASPGTRKGKEQAPTINTAAFNIGKSLGNIYHRLTDMWEYKDQINENHVFIIEESIRRMNDLIGGD